VVNRQANGQNFLLFTPCRKNAQVEGDGVNRKFTLVDVEAFQETAVLIPDIGDDETLYFRARPRPDWSDLFSRWIRRPHLKEFTETEE
jgi:hypothetical protein